MIRDYGVQKGDNGETIVSLYQDDVTVLEARVVSVLAGSRLGAAWVSSSPKG